MRVRLTEMNLKRVYDAVHRRIQDIPDSLSWRYSARAQANRERLKKLQARHWGERCFVMANGPSLAGMNLEMLRGMPTISMNRAYLLYEEWGFIPSYYVCINELVLEQFSEDIANLPMPKFVNFDRRRLFPDFEQDNDLMYLRLGLNLRDRFSGDVTQPISSGGTVTFACLQLAYFMGFREVVLVGLDHNFVEKGIPNTTEVRKSEKDESHCHPDYFPKGIKWQLPDLYRSEQAYVLARQAYERDGRRILDATQDGNCHVFPKVDFYSLF